MGVPKGTDNFQKFRQTKVDSNFRLLREVLANMQRRKLPYPNLSVLINDVADRTKIHRTTLKRNPIYLKELLDYLASQPGATSTVADEDASPALLRAKLYDAKLEAKNLRTQLSISEAGKTSETPIPSSDAHLPGAKQPNWYLAFSDTAMVLRELIDSINSDGETIRVDLDRGEILDISAAPGKQVIASGVRARPYMDLYRKLLVQEGKLKEKK